MKKLFRKSGIRGSWSLEALHPLRCLVLTLAAVACSIGADQAVAQGATNHGQINITQASEWNFGTMYTSTIPGTITVTPDGLVTAKGGVISLEIPSQPIVVATFDVTGDANSSYSLVFPATVTLQRVGGTETMLIDQFVPSLGAGLLDANGKQTITIGATLHVNPMQPSGQYQGLNVVTVTYN